MFSDRIHVLVVGDVMLDRFWQGPTSRISPEAPVPVVQVRDDHVTAGGAANVAMNVASLGANTYLIGAIGTDANAQLLLEKLKHNRVIPDLIECGKPTITKLRVLSRGQQMIRMDFEESFEPMREHEMDKLLDAYRQAVPISDVVIFSDYGKGTLTKIRDMIEMAQKHHVPVIIDPKGTNYKKYFGATMITPNLAEFEAVVGKCNSEEELLLKAEGLRTRLELQAVLITRSEKGMTLVQADSEPLYFPTEAREVFDVTGAGDTVIATLGIAIGAHYPLEEACRVANHAAGVVVGKLGTAVITIDELKDAMKSKQTGIIKDELELKHIVETEKRLGRTVVMTNGCFDILHAGHIQYLQAARALGDILIVAVNSDDSVRRLKGNERPVNTCEDRMKVLAALKCVDLVVEFDEDTPERLISVVLPTVLTKGGDYDIDQIAGRVIVEANGGRVVTVAFLPNYSTTKLIEKLRS